MNEAEDGHQLTQYWRTHIDASKASGASNCKKNVIVTSITPGKKY